MQKCELITKSGRLIDVLNPRPEDICLEDIAHGLAHVCRWHGHSRIHYSVAQHSMMVATLLPSALCAQALLHDAAETYLGDLPTPLKRLMPEYKQIEDRLHRIICERFGVTSEMPDELKQADKVALATEAYGLGLHPEAWLSPACLVNPVLLRILAESPKHEISEVKDAYLRALNNALGGE